jgi:hypothetical protein
MIYALYAILAAFWKFRVFCLVSADFVAAYAVAAFRKIPARNVVMFETKHASHQFAHVLAEVLRESLSCTKS